MIYLPRDLHAALDRLRDAKANVSAIAEEALRAHPKVAEELERVPSGVGSGPCPSRDCPFARCTDPTHWASGE